MTMSAASSSSVEARAETARREEGQQEAAEKLFGTEAMSSLLPVVGASAAASPAAGASTGKHHGSSSGRPSPGHVDLAHTIVDALGSVLALFCLAGGSTPLRAAREFADDQQRRFPLSGATRPKKYSTPIQQQQQEAMTAAVFSAAELWDLTIESAAAPAVHWSPPQPSSPTAPVAFVSQLAMYRCNSLLVSWCFETAGNNNNQSSLDIPASFALAHLLHKRLAWPVPVPHAAAQDDSLEQQEQYRNLSCWTLQVANLLQFVSTGNRRAQLPLAMSFCTTLFLYAQAAAAMSFRFGFTPLLSDTSTAAQQQQQQPAFATSNAFSPAPAASNANHNNNSDNLLIGFLGFLHSTMPRMRSLLRGFAEFSDSNDSLSNNLHLPPSLQARFFGQLPLLASAVLCRIAQAELVARAPLKCMPQLLPGVVADLQRRKAAKVTDNHHNRNGDDAAKAQLALAKMLSEEASLLSVDMLTACSASVAWETLIALVQKQRTERLPHANKGMFLTAGFVCAWTLFDVVRALPPLVLKRMLAPIGGVMNNNNNNGGGAADHIPASLQSLIGECVELVDHVYAKHSHSLQQHNNPLDDDDDATAASTNNNNNNNSAKLTLCPFSKQHTAAHYLTGVECAAATAEHCCLPPVAARGASVIRSEQHPLLVDAPLHALRYVTSAVSQLRIPSIFDNRPPAAADERHVAAPIALRLLLAKQLAPSAGTAGGGVYQQQFCEAVAGSSQLVIAALKDARISSGAHHRAGDDDNDADAARDAGEAVVLALLEILPDIKQMPVRDAILRQATPAVAPSRAVFAALLDRSTSVAPGALVHALAHHALSWRHEAPPQRISEGGSSSSSESNPLWPKLQRLVGQLSAQDRTELASKCDEILSSDREGGLSTQRCFWLSQMIRNTHSGGGGNGTSSFKAPPTNSVVMKKPPTSAPVKSDPAAARNNAGHGNDNNNNNNNNNVVNVDDDAETVAGGGGAGFSSTQDLMDEFNSGFEQFEHVVGGGGKQQQPKGKKMVQQSFKSATNGVIFSSARQQQKQPPPPASKPASLPAAQQQQQPAKQAEVQVISSSSTLSFSGGGAKLSARNLKAAPSNNSNGNGKAQQLQQQQPPRVPSVVDAALQDQEAAYRWDQLLDGLKHQRERLEVALTRAILKVRVDNTSAFTFSHAGEMAAEADGSGGVMRGLVADGLQEHLQELSKQFGDVAGGDNIVNANDELSYARGFGVCLITEARAQLTRSLAELQLLFKKLRQQQQHQQANNNWEHLHRDYLSGREPQSELASVNNAYDCFKVNLFDKVTCKADQYIVSLVLAADYDASAVVSAAGGNNNNRGGKPRPLSLIFNDYDVLLLQLQVPTDTVNPDFASQNMFEAQQQQQQTVTCQFVAVVQSCIGSGTDVFVKDGAAEEARHQLIDRGVRHVDVTVIRSHTSEAVLMNFPKRMPGQNHSSNSGGAQQMTMMPSWGEVQAFKIGSLHASMQQLRAVHELPKTHFWSVLSGTGTPSLNPVFRNELKQQQQPTSTSLLTRATRDIIHRLLNVEGAVNRVQQQAVSQVFQNDFQPYRAQQGLAPASEERNAGMAEHPLQLVSGPPGTGKSHLIVHLVLRWVLMARMIQRAAPAVAAVTQAQRGGGRGAAAAAAMQNPFGKSAPVLVCAPSNAAVDEVVMRVLQKGRHMMNALSRSQEGGGQQQQLNVLRIGVRTSVRQDVLEAGVFIEDAIERLVTQSQPGGGQRGTGGSISYLEAKRRVLASADVIFSTLGSLRNWLPKRCSFVIVDECSQAIEPSALVPIALMGCERAVLIGDHRQLRPVVLSVSDPSQKAPRFLHTSVMERLLVHRAGSSSVVNGQQQQLLLLLQHVQLQEQYRMHPTISAFPNRFFYDSRLRDANAVLQPSRSRLAQILSDAKQMPLATRIVFLDVVGTETPSGSGSTSNEQESNLVVNLLRGIKNTLLANSPEQLIENVATITFYQAQRQLIRAKLPLDMKKAPSTGQSLRVQTVDSFQGQESSAVVLSLVRCSNNKKGGAKASVGFLDDANRLNVALTRAKDLLFVVGDADHVSRGCETLRELVAHCRKTSGAFIDKQRVAQANQPQGLDLTSLLLKK